MILKQLSIRILESENSQSLCSYKCKVSNTRYLVHHVRQQVVCMPDITHGHLFIWIMHDRGGLVEQKTLYITRGLWRRGLVRGSITHGLWRGGLGLVRQKRLYLVNFSVSLIK